jgi:hypothetical protein
MNKFKVGDSVFVISDAKWAADVLSFGYIGDNIVYRVKNTENTTFTDSFVFEEVGRDIKAGKGFRDFKDFRDGKASEAMV